MTTTTSSHHAALPAAAPAAHTAVPATGPGTARRTADRRRDARWVRPTLLTIAAFQFFLGAAFLVAPGRTADLLDLPDAPGWTAWMFGMMGARFIGYGVGMVAAAGRPSEHRLWIDTMIAIQAVDWVVTMIHLANGDVLLRQVTTAAVVPVLFVGLLLAGRPRRVGSDA